MSPPLVKLKYYDAQAFKPVPIHSKTRHSEFLRNGEIKRFEEGWLPRHKRYYSLSEVELITEQRLMAAGERAYLKLNSVHPSLLFKNMVYPRVVRQLPHLGYCHVTASRGRIETLGDFVWSFYFANFDADIGGDERFFENINPKFSRMYFAVALNKSGNEQVKINQKIRDRGILFKTTDPQEALYNVLMLRSRSSAQRAFIKSIQT